MADAHSCIQLRDDVEAYIHNHFLAVTQEEEYRQLDKDILIKFLNSENLHIDSEFQVFQAAMKWVTHDTTARRRFVFEVLAPIRFPIISQQQLEKYIEECDDLSLKIALRKLAQDYKKDRKVPIEVKLGRLKPYLLQPRKCARKNIYVIGGYSRESGGRWSDSQSLTSVEYFNSFSQEWKKGPNMRRSRSSHGVAVLNGCIYVIGGESDSLIYDSMECFDPAINKWTFEASMVVSRCGLGVCSLNGYIYAIGGWVGSEIGNSIERYDPQQRHWNVVDKMPVSMLRFAMGITTHEGQF